MNSFKTPHTVRENLSRAFYTSPIDVVISTSRTLKVKKNHCFFYDVLLHAKLNDTTLSEQKENYYIELFEDKYDGPTNLNPSEIDTFFTSKDLVYENETLKDKLLPSEKTLFVIPVAFVMLN